MNGGENYKLCSIVFIQKILNFLNIDQLRLIQNKEEGNDQELKHSSTILDIGHNMGK